MQPSKAHWCSHPPKVLHAYQLAWRNGSLLTERWIAAMQVRTCCIQHDRGDGIIKSQGQLVPGHTLLSESQDEPSRLQQTSQTPLPPH